MKNKKGFTLIEVIVTVSLLALISTIILLSISSAKQKHDQESWIKLTARIKSAASVYMNDNEGLKALVYSGTTIYVDIQDLIDAGILDENYIYDPTDGVNVLEKTSVVYHSVKVFLNANDAVEYVYPAYTTSYMVVSPTRVSGYTDTSIDYLEGVTVFNDNGIEVSNTVVTDIQKTGGKIYTASHTIVFPTAGEYVLTYNFNDISYNRTYFIETLTDETVTPEGPEQLINPDQIYDEPGDYTYQTVLDGTYTIRVYGAKGDNFGGKGGYAAGDIYLAGGDILTITIGGTPTSEGIGGYNGGGIGAYGGGGASFVKLGGTTLLLAAGGGGGATGTAGGAGTSLGGAAVDNDTDLETVTTETPLAGAAGTDGGGGGSGNKYNMCLEYEEVYDACATTTNTCSPGCATCLKAVYQTLCSSDGGDIVPVEKTYKCSPEGDCTACTWLRWDYYSCNCSDCYYGSPTTCVGGFVKGDCISLGEELTKPGQGGTSMIDPSMQNVTLTSGLKDGDGRVEIKLIVEGSGS